MRPGSAATGSALTPWGGGGHSDKMLNNGGRAHPGQGQGHLHEQKDGVLLPTDVCSQGAVMLMQFLEGLE